MRIIHTSICDQKLMLWGEKKLDESTLNRPKRRGRPGQNPPPKEHPFVLSKEELLETFNQTIPLGVEEEQIEKVLLWLPSEASLPYPSSPLIGELPPSKSEPSLKRWVAYAVECSPEQIFQFLHCCQGKKMVEEGVVLGKEIPFLVHAMQFATSLVVRQRFLPAIVEEHREYRAAWEPVFLGNDQARLSQLQKAFPSVCRSLSLSMKREEPDTTTPETVLKRFITALVESIIHLACKTKNFPTSTLHDQWLSSLLNGEIITQDHNASTRLVKQIQEWKRPIALSLTSPYRLCLRLEEPELEEKTEAIQVPQEGWFLRYLLQAHDDPSFLVDVNDIWNPKGTKKKVLEKKGGKLRQHLLSSLGIAAGMSSIVEASLKKTAPTGCELDSDQSMEFLTLQAAQFEDAGFGVILPSWWIKNKKTPLTAQAFANNSPFKSKSNKPLWEMVKLDWKVAIDGQQFTIEELEEIAAMKSPLVSVRGQWMYVSEDYINKAIAFLKQRMTQKTTVQDVIQMELGIAGNFSVKIEPIQAKGTLKKLLNQFRNKTKIDLLPSPKNFSGTLRPYQLQGVSWMSFLRKWGLGACLADDMGLGKTPQTLALLQHAWDEEEERKPSLLVCPTSLTGNWSKEAKKFVPNLPIHVHHGPERLKGDAFYQTAAKQGLVITTYGLLHRDLETFQKINWRTVILDEAQNIKNALTRQSLAARALKAECRIALTGTPIENNVGDLWSLMEFLNPGHLGSENQFNDAFFKPIQLQGDKEATEHLQKLTSPFILRRLKSDKSIIKDLPEKEEMDLACTLTQEQATLYGAIIHDANTVLEKVEEGIQKKGIVLATLTKLKQVCNHPGQFLKDGNNAVRRSGKLMRLTEMLEEVLSIGERSLIFTQFSEMGELMKTHLEEALGEEVLFLHGGVPKKKRDHMVERFQDKSDDAPKIFILSLKAGGTGLNLTTANHVFHYDRWWNPAIENQATDRAYRIGQTKNVQVHKFICSGTLEERIAEIIENKKQVADNVVGSGEGWLTKLSTDALKDLWALREEAF